MAKYVMFKKEPQSNSGITNPERQIIDLNVYGAKRLQAV